jgi:aminopeptidase N
MALLTRRSAAPETTADAEYLAAMVAVAEDDRLDPAFKALALSLPPEEEIVAHMAAAGITPDPAAVHAARRGLDRDLARALGGRLEALHAGTAAAGPYSPDAAAAGRRALRSRALALLTALDPEARLARARFEAADNMTETMAALGLLVANGAAEAALAAFHARWHHDRLVLDKWFAVQAAMTPPGIAAERVAQLTRHPDFEWTNPNRFRSLIGAFATGNTAGFHRGDGAGYRLVADWQIRLDPVNPQTAARTAGAFGTLGLFDRGRQAMIRTELKRIAARPGLSRDSAEMVGRMLASGP